ncbi:hypothetical protein D1B17_11810 [Companilactobacillus zhachilii]|uniref:Lipoprotein n=1 Tax=Companilactobacillus zhachilii TaxID=2304606 RepID=A0A386PTD3_9LACO|nr:hypothetical protein [Companilactobacillus zhachilii]AYE39276.1 hypothetical protein D1B17_11810 [Companilactobacillus zhachilii]
MNKKGIIALATLLVSGTFVMAGCSMGNVTINDNSRETKQPKETKAEKSKDVKVEAKKKAQAKQADRGKEYSYGIAKGPTWLYVYDNGKKTDTHFNPDKESVVKLHEYDTFKLGGTLPLVGEQFTRSYSVGQNSSQATMDQSDNYDKQLGMMSLVDPDNRVKVTFGKISHPDYAGLSKLAFTDLPKYLEAASTNDSSKLPNQSKHLVGNLDNSTNYRGDAAASYQIIEQYFDKKSTKNDEKGPVVGDHATYVSTGNDPLLEETNATQLFIQVFAKVKKTDTDQHAFRTDDGPKYGSSSTKIEEYQLDYLLNENNNWQLAGVTNVGSSDYAMDTSHSNWIVQKN